MTHRHSYDFEEDNCGMCQLEARVQALEVIMSALDDAVNQLVADVAQAVTELGNLEAEITALGNSGADVTALQAAHASLQSALANASTSTVAVSSATSSATPPVAP